MFKSGQEESFLEAGINYLNAGEYGKALSCFDELIRVDPINSEAYRLKGWATFTGRPAISILRWLTTTRPSSWACTESTSTTATPRHTRPVD